MCSSPRRESRGEAPSGGRAPRFFPNYVLIDARRAIQNRFITKLISVRHSGFALGRGSLLGKNGERILWGKHFRIGNFPHFSPLKNFERRSVFFKMA